MPICLKDILPGWLLLFLLFGGGQSYAANEIVIDISGRNKVNVLENTSNRLLISNTIGSFNSLILNTEKGEFVELLLNSYSNTNAIGLPQLPVLSKLIEVPEGASPQVKVISYEVKEYKLSDFGITQKIIPVQPPEPKSSSLLKPFEYNRQLYETNSFYGEKLARIEMAGYLRKVRLANLVLSPVEYNPVSNTIKVYNNLVVEIRFSGASSLKSTENKAKTRSPYFNSVYSNVLNYKSVEATVETTSTVPVKYVIVSDPMFQSALQPFIKWKTKRGFNVVEAYTNNPAVGKSLISIKTYLQNLYTSATPSDPAPTFVLFVGDVAQIPAFDCGSHVSDLYYCEYTGDFLPDVFYGRFSANTVAELLPQINKTLQYEQYLMPDPSFLNRVVLTAGADASHQARWGNGQINYGASYYFNAAHNLDAHIYLQPEPPGGNYSQNIKANISDGVSYANYTAHGSPEGWADPSFTISDVAKLHNADKYGLMVGNSCQSNSYNLNSFGEALLRAENKGALGYIGASDLSYWDEDYWWGVGSGSIVSNPTYESTGLGAYDRTFHDHGETDSEWYSTMGQMVFAGNLAVQESNSGMKKYYWEIYCLMGDPSTMIYFSVPPALPVSYPAFLQMGAPTFEVHTEPYAYVAISKNNILHGVAGADESGLAVVSFQAFSEPGYADIVITKQNRQPYIDSVLIVTPERPYLVPGNFLIKDKEGNNNQLPEFDESLTMDVTLKNIGIPDAINVNSTLSTNDSYLTIQANKHAWPLISGNGSAIGLNAFSIQVNDNIPDMHKATVTLLSQVDTSSFTSQFAFTIYAPSLVNGSIIFDDSTAGNGNGQIDPGETIYITMPTTNTGHCSSAEVTSRLFVFCDNDTSVMPALNLGTLVPGATGISTFSFSVSPDVQPGGILTLFISATAGPYNSVSSLAAVVGSRIEDFETADFMKYNWGTKGAKPWEICLSDKSEGLYGARSGVINNSESSVLFIEGQVLFNDTISFYRKVSSEKGYDFLKFYLDDSMLDSWSGVQDWEKVSYPITAGNHRFSWVYEKDEATIAGTDAAYIDYIHFPVFSQPFTGPLSVKALAVPATICAGGQSQLYILATGAAADEGYTWTPAATLNNSGIFNPFASPAETTTYSVQVSSKSLFATGAIKVNVEQPPAKPVVTVLSDHLVSSALSGNQWYSSQGLIEGETAQVYFPPYSGTYYVITHNINGCPSSVSTKVEFEYKDRKAAVENNFLIFPNPFTGKLHMEYTTQSEGNIKIVIYNSIGKEVKCIDEGEKTAGDHQAEYNGSNLEAGIYTCKIFSGESVQIARVIKIK
ncbi:MAG: C25 family cysteine peptidase [Lentimicrobiaceae bacterium]|jgi:hypothetical protein